VTPDEFASRWPGARSQMQPDVAKQLAIPEASRLFLIRAGLPVDVRFNGLGFDLSGPLRRLPSDPRLVEISRPRLGGTVVCVQETQQGAVVQVEGTGGQALQFLNSSAEQHAACWLAWRTIVDGSTGQDDAITAQLLRQAFLAEDPAAIAGDELPWSILLHEVELGIL
jgi:hypothetical protein